MNERIWIDHGAVVAIKTNREYRLELEEYEPDYDGQVREAIEKIEAVWTTKAKFSVAYICELLRLIKEFQDSDEKAAVTVRLGNDTPISFEINTAEDAHCLIVLAPIVDGLAEKKEAVE